MRRISMYLLFLSLFVAIIGFPLVAVHAAPSVPQAVEPVATDWASLLVTFKSLTGAAMLIAAVVNILKSSGIAKDNQASAWSAGLNLAALVALFIFQLHGKSNDVPALDSQAGSLSTVIEVIFAFFWQLWASRKTHDVILAGLPYFGSSYSNKFAGEGNIAVLNVES